jgi:hypothetical protein
MLRMRHHLMRPTASDRRLRRTLISSIIFICGDAIQARCHARQSSF